MNRGLIGMIAAIGLAAPALAGDSDYSTRETRALTHAYAQCVVKRRTAVASEALLANVDNTTLMRRYSTLIVPACLDRHAPRGTQMSFAGDLYRYALADALVNREFAALPAPDFGSVAPLAHRAVPQPAEASGAKARRLSRDAAARAAASADEAEASHFLALYGECLVRAAPSEARALLLTVPDSTDEAARFAALHPSLRACLPETRTVSFGKTALRGTIAINYYRLAHAARGTPAATAS